MISKYRMALTPHPAYFFGITHGSYAQRNGQEDYGCYGHFYHSDEYISDGLRVFVATSGKKIPKRIPQTIAKSTW